MLLVLTPVDVYLCGRNLLLAQKEAKMYTYATTMRLTPLQLLLILCFPLA